MESRYLTRAINYYLNDSAAGAQGDLPWSSIEISARLSVLDVAFLNPPSHVHTCDWGDSEMEDSPKSDEIARTAPPDAHDAQLSNGPIGASIRVREVPIQQCQHGSHLTAHSFGVESQARARSR